MAYNNYFPQYYPSAAPFGNNQQNSGITWVQGEQAAKSYPVAAGQSILLLDSEASCFYIKSTDQSGMPLPLRIFDFTERVPEAAPTQPVQTQTPVYVTKEEFDIFRNEIKSEIKNTGYKPNYKKKEDN